MKNYFTILLLVLSNFISEAAFSQCSTAPVPMNAVLTDVYDICTLTVSKPKAIGCNNDTIEGTTTSPLTYTTVGTYTITWTYSDGINDTTQDQTVWLFPIPTPTITTTTGDSTFCKGSNFTLSSNSTTGNFWSGGGITSTNQSITISSADTYSLTTNINGCSASVSQEILMDDGMPAKPLITAFGSTTICEGAGVALKSSSPNNNEWVVGIPANPIFGGTDSILGTTDSIYSTHSGTYLVRVTNSCGSSSSDAKTVVVNPLTAEIRTAGSTAICPGESVLLISNSPTGNTWTGGSGNDSITVLAAKDYILKVDNGCGSPSYDTVTIIHKPIPEKPYLAPFDSACSNSLQIPLEGGIPAGGTFSGNAVFFNTYSPGGLELLGGLLGGLGGLLPGGGFPGIELPVADTSSREGDLITYTYTDPITGCSNSTSEYIYLKTCTDIKENSLKLNIQLFPNPAHENTSVSISSALMGKIVIEVIDVLGNSVSVESDTKTSVDFLKSINISALTKGVYNLRITLGEEISSQKLVVQ